MGLHFTSNAVYVTMCPHGNWGCIYRVSQKMFDHTEHCVRVCLWICLYLCVCAHVWVLYVACGAIFASASLCLSISCADIFLATTYDCIPWKWVMAKERIPEIENRTKPFNQRVKYIFKSRDILNWVDANPLCVLGMWCGFAILGLITKIWSSV